MPVRPRTHSRPARLGLLRHWATWIYVPLALGLSLAGVCLWKSGNWLVAEDSFGKIPWAVVMAGESRDCERTDAAIKLYLDGRIDTLIESSVRVFKNRYGSEFMVEYLVQNGYPRGKVFEFRQDAYSTLEEARQLIRQFRLQNLDTVLVITSNYHTARTRRIFRKLAQGFPQVLVYPAEYHAFDPSAWWVSRESRKYWLSEWLKTLYTYFELFGALPENGKADFQNLIPDIWSAAPKTGEGGKEPEAGMPPSPAVHPDGSLDSAGVPAGDTLPGGADDAEAFPPVDSSAISTADSGARREADTSAARPRTAKPPADSQGAKASARETAKPAAKPEKPEARKTIRDIVKKAPDKGADKSKSKKKGN